MAPKLSINLNAVAMLRNRRDVPWPSLTDIGRIALRAGGHGLTVHPRPDQRHIRFCDLPDIRNLIDAEFEAAEFNIEGFPTDQFLQLVADNRPDQVTLVPDDPVQSTSDHGWDFIANAELLKSCVGRLKDQGFRVSLFCDPDASAQQVAAAASTGADRLELYTGPYGAQYENPEQAIAEVAKLKSTAQMAQTYGLLVNAGHDLTVANIPAVVQAIPTLSEVSIGHAMTAQALEFGMAQAVRDFLAACDS